MAIIQKKIRWYDLKKILVSLDMSKDSIRHIKEDCKERKTARF